MPDALTLTLRKMQSTDSMQMVDVHLASFPGFFLMFPGRRFLRLLHSPWRKDETSMVLGAANLLILPTRGLQSLASLPSKLIAYMLAGRAVLALAIAGTDLTVAIERAECWVVDSYQPDMLANKIREVVQLSATELAQHGEAGRYHALRNLTGEVCLPKVNRVLERAAAQRG